MNFEHKEITERIIGVAFEVRKILSYGLLEKVYQKVMQVELKDRGLKAELEKPIKVEFKNHIVGDYFADLFVEDNKVVVELKEAESYNPKDGAQLINELKATAIRLGLLINFGRERVEFKQLVHG